jgi:hypothetical protein
MKIHALMCFNTTITTNLSNFMNLGSLMYFFDMGHMGTIEISHVFHQKNHGVFSIFSPRQRNDDPLDLGK